MKSRFLFLAVLAALSGSMSSLPVHAQESSGTHKSVRDMTPEERKLFWEQLPEEQKQKIIARREAVMKEQAHQQKWKNLSGKPSSGGVVGTNNPAPNGNTGIVPPGEGSGAQGQWMNDPNLSEEQKARIQRGADLWSSMTPEQKKAFVAQHQGQIRTHMGANQ